MMVHFPLGVKALKTLMTGAHSPSSFLTDCHISPLAVFPVDLNDFLVTWQAFVRGLSESDGAERNVMLRDLCCEFMCACELYVAGGNVTELLIMRIRSGRKGGSSRARNKPISSFLGRVHVCKERPGGPPVVFK